MGAGFRIAVISERWERNPDEGMLVYLDRMSRFFHEQAAVQIFYDQGAAPPQLSSVHVPMGRGLISAALKEELDRFGPDVIIYVPTACATLGALVRHRRLALMADVPCALLSLQSREYPFLIRRCVLPRLRPWRMIVLSHSAAHSYRAVGFNVVETRPGVDMERFRPSTGAERGGLRQLLGLDDDLPIALHVGHLAAYRNLEQLESLARSGHWRVVMVASTANPPDPEIRASLERAGVVVRREFVTHIENYYRAADLYVFPVCHGSGAIEFPLSVLEAMACDLRIVTTPFGALPEHFVDGGGLCYVEGNLPIGDAAMRVSNEQVATRAMLSEFTWDAALSTMLIEVKKGVV